MAQRINLHNSPLVFKLLKAFYVTAAFVHFALLARLLALLPLVGRKFLPGGIQSFFKQAIYGLTAFEFFLSVAQLIPIAPLQFIVGNAVKVGAVWVLDKDVKLQRHSAYGIYIFDLSFIGIIAYLYHLQKLMYLGHVPGYTKTLFQTISIVEFPIRAVLEFIILFMGLKYVQDTPKLGLQLVLLVFVPAKVLLYKRQLNKFFQGDTVKTD